MNNTRIIITGGSGFIGTSAVDYSIAKGWDCINIDIKSPNKLEHEKYWQNVDIRERDNFINAIIEFKPTHILHLAAKTGMDIKDFNELSANTDGVKYLIEGANLVKTVKCIVFTSSLLVCENGYVPRNDFDYCPPNLYGKSKMLGEQIVRNSDRNFRAIIVRPTSIWGPWFEHSYKKFFQIINKGLYFHIGIDNQIKPKSYVKNTVYMMFCLLFSDASNVENQVFYLSDYPQGNTKEWANIIAGKLKKKIFTLPGVVIKTIARCGDLFKVLGFDPPLTTFRLNNMLTGGDYPIVNTRQIVGDLPYDLETAVAETIDWMREKNFLE